MQETSIESWKEYKDSPSRSNCILSVIKTLREQGPSTGREICAAAGQDGLWKRLSEMEKAGMTKTIGKRTCSITGKKALIWALSGEKKKAPIVESNNLFDVILETEFIRNKIFSALDIVNKNS